MTRKLRPSTMGLKQFKNVISMMNYREDHTNGRTVIMFGEAPNPVTHFTFAACGRLVMVETFHGLKPEELQGARGHRGVAEWKGSVLNEEP